MDDEKYWHEFKGLHIPDNPIPMRITEDGNIEGFVDGKLVKPTAIINEDEEYIVGG